MSKERIEINLFVVNSARFSSLGGQGTSRRVKIALLRVHLLGSFGKQ
jgi:hypothetical protein